MKGFTCSGFAAATAAALALSQSVSALEGLTAPGLITACKAHEENRQSPEATSCRAFIQGYLSASTDVVASEDQPSPFVARAIRTRASRLSEDAEQRLNSRYCLPGSTAIDTLAAKVAGISQPVAEEATAESLLIGVLNAHFRCDDAAGE
ncbi:Rap1a/Tai family immunity protein [Microbulbifer sp. YPW1]|uniref:Rap1a/Tai family immunity protein n=1 Tax=unclassified Microbulbifer TaxID=2619833 RepID=UPI001597B49D|nr:Rap1a/Tai family immunity protein [Microbulbifer sp. YPW1]QKX17249.1 hypothetical protein HUW35_09690 [Microbulbifer sp. YPW1]